MLIRSSEEGLDCGDTLCRFFLDIFFSGISEMNSGLANVNKLFTNNALTINMFLFMVTHALGA